MEGQRRAKTAVAAATTTTMPEKDKRRRRQRQRAMTPTPKHCSAGSTNDTTPTGTRRGCRSAGWTAWVCAVEHYHTQLPTLTAPAHALRPQLTINTTNVGQGQPPANDAANDMPPTAGPTEHPLLPLRATARRVDTGCRCTEDGRGGRGTIPPTPAAR